MSTLRRRDIRRQKGAPVLKKRSSCVVYAVHMFLHRLSVSAETSNHLPLRLARSASVVVAHPTNVHSVGPHVVQEGARLPGRSEFDLEILRNINSAGMVSISSPSRIESRKDVLGGRPCSTSPPVVGARSCPARGHRGDGREEGRHSIHQFVQYVASGMAGRTGGAMERCEDGVSPGRRRGWREG